MNQRPVEIYTADEFDRMLRACPRKTLLGLRNRAILAMLWGAGLRVSELCDLMPGDVMDDGGINVRSGKGSKQRFCAIDQQNLAVVSLWMDRRDPLVGTDAPLFCTASAGVYKRMSRQSVWAILRRIASRAGINKRMHPHALRHSMAARFLANRVPLNLLQQQLGHLNLATTSHYAARVSPQQIIEAVNHQQIRTVEIDGRRFRVISEEAA